CGSQAPSGCHCDAQCQNFNDCCPDKVAVCDSPPAPNSCRDRCGPTQAPSGCFCDDSCAIHGDCCPDINIFCN
ncbi:MAG: peptidase S8, partial [Polyangiaceae bacterium]|nr:peptidase S8 [Polyangiaceae bacterium]